MAASSIASQLQAIKSLVKANTEPLKRPFTRPSILFDPKEAADIDIDTLFSIAVSGLEDLSNVDERFQHFRNDLFSQKSREVDRELMGVEDNKRIDASINSYLRLLSGHLHLRSAFNTLEYLIRRYKVHVYNTEELILSAIPYHDTHAFVRIVQLIDLGNSRWKFLDGVKESGAPLPRNVIVRQCMTDMGVLEALCNYAAPVKKYQPSVPVTGFCTAVVIEVLGYATTIDNAVVQRILPFVVSALQSGRKGSPEYKAGALMVIGLLAKKVTLSPKLVRSLVQSITEMARADARESADLQWFQISVTALITIVQLQSVEALPRKVVDVLKEIRDLPGILSVLSKKFNIDSFLIVLWQSLVDYSSNIDNLCKDRLVAIAEAVPVSSVVHHLVSRLLSSCLRLSVCGNTSELPELGSWAKEVLVVFHKKHPQELRRAFHKFLEDAKVQSKGDSVVLERLCKMLDGPSDTSFQIPDSKIWFALEHPKAEIRRSTLHSLEISALLKDNSVNPKRLTTIQDTVLRRLEDDDLSVAEAALSLDGLSELVNPQDLFQAFQNLLTRCTRILLSDASNDSVLAGDVAVSCLQCAVSCFKNKSDFQEGLASLIFPLLLILPKAKLLNMKALECAKETKLPLYRNIAATNCLEKKPGKEWYSSVNATTVNSLADVFSADVLDYLPLLAKFCNSSELSKTLSLFVILQSSMMEITAVNAAIFEACFAFLKAEWQSLNLTEDALSGEEITSEFSLLYELNDTTDLKKLNARILVCTFWWLIKAHVRTKPALLDDSGDWMRTLQELYVFFAECNMRHVFKEHRHYIVLAVNYPVHFLLKFVNEGASYGVQVESLCSLTSLCSTSDEGLGLQLLAEFPSVLAPLFSEIKDVRVEAMNYLEELSSLWSRVSSTAKKNGSMESWFSVTEDLLSMLVRQKKLILSDKNFLQSLLSSVLSSSFQSLLAPEFSELRFDRSNAEEILGFILGRALKYPSYAKMKILSLLKEVGDAVMQNKNVQSLLHELLRQRNDYLFRHDKSCLKLSSLDVEILCLLVEMCFMATASDVHCFEDPLLMVLRIDDISLDEPVVTQPCITLLKKLNNCFFGSMKTEKQECLLQEVVLLYQHPNSDVQDAAREAVMHLTITSVTLSNLLDAAINCEDSKFKRRKSVKESHSMIPSGENVFRFLSSLLDIMVLKKDIHDRAHLVNPLFQLLGKILSKKLSNVIITEDMVQSATGVSQSMPNAMCYIQQTVLLILEDIIASFSSASDISLEGVKLDNSEIALLVECARYASTHSHTFSVFAAISKIMPSKVLDFIPDMLAILCRSTDSQSGHSKHIFEDFISAVVPCWLSNKNEAVTLLQILVNVLPEVAQHQRLSITIEFLRTIGESTGLGLLLLLLFRSLALRQGSITAENKLLSSGPSVSGAVAAWEYMFATQICEQHTCTIWLPSLVVLLQQLRAGNHSQELFVELLLAMQFISDKLQNPELLFKLRLGGDINTIQETLADLMEQVVCSLHLVDSLRKEIKVTVTIKKGLKELIHNAFNFISKGMAPSSFFEGIVRLLCHDEKSVRKKALQLLCETMKYLGTEKSRKEKKSYMQLIGSWDNLDDSAWASFDAMSRKILQLLDESLDDQDASVKLIGFSALEILANKFSSDHTIFSKCLASIVKNALSEDLAVSSACLRTTGALIKVLGTRALSELPQIMKCLLERSKNMRLPFHVTVKDANKKSSQSIVGESVMVSSLVTLEAVVEKLGPFLSPYLDDILEVLVLHPDYISQSGQGLKAKADSIRRLLSEKIPVRLALPSLLKIYRKAVNSGDTSLSITFEMIAKFVGTMDKSSISTFHAKIFDMSLLALDLRRQSQPSVKNIAVVEKHVIDALIVLTLKLTETTFKPLFIKAIEWAESSVEPDDSRGVTNIKRAISFYNLVNRLAESHRSLFVPYFKYLLESCLQYLTDNKAQGAGSRKKAKHDGMEGCKFISVEMWHLRSLVISALQKCFLFDIGTRKFLDSSNFQVLLKPVVSQLGVEPPASVKDYPDIPSTEEVDNLLVSCIGQMAVTSGSDLLWKPLNYEVLMQTRSELVRSRMLGLRIVKNLIQNLKEEYLVLLAETIPFLAELLEDVELPIKSLAQEILKELETMSGEDLRQCF